jgi:NAD(P)-dependent dehydrogenase (short-subunit alcohol dehydrogenase family)
VGTQVVLITGGLTGIGRAAAVAFAKKGANVVVAGRRDEAGEALVKELGSFGSEAEFINADVRKEDDLRAMVDKTVARFDRLDVAVNNAATEGLTGPITDQTAESFNQTFETNALGVVLSMKHEVFVASASQRRSPTALSLSRPTKLGGSPPRSECRRRYDRKLILSGRPGLHKGRKSNG